MQSKIQVGEENSQVIRIHYEDLGQGQPAVLIHGFPQSGAAWEHQVPALLHEGFRTIAYDRRGFGQSSHPSSGYEYDTLSSDLEKLLNRLELTDAILVGHSMGAGEVIRYLAKYGTARVSKAVLVAPVAPFILQAPDNPDGLPKSLFDGFQKSVREDRLAYLTEFFGAFYHSGLLTAKKVSGDALQYQWNVAAGASPIATHECIPAWTTDFRKDLARITTPMLVLQGTADQVLPFELTGKRIPEFARGSTVVPIEGASHGLLWTHSHEVNEALLRFMGRSSKQAVA